MPKYLCAGLYSVTMAAMVGCDASSWTHQDGLKWLILKQTSPMSA